MFTESGNSLILFCLTLRYRSEVHSPNLAGKPWRKLCERASLLWETTSAERRTGWKILRLALPF